MISLNLAENNIEKKGFAHLSDVLKDVNCKRTILDLVKSNLGNKGVENFVCSMEETKALNT